MKILFTLLFLMFTCFILTHPDISLSYALTGLELWFSKMIPTLLPFMIMSGIMISLRLTEGFTAFVYPILKPFFRISKNVCYGMLMGFLCGFPMGAKTVQDLYSQKLISLREASFLLAFCNNIGPVYFCGFVLPLLHIRPTFPYLFAMYGLPLLYGLLLRYTVFRDLDSDQKCLQGTQKVLHAASFQQAPARSGQRSTFLLQLLTATDISIFSSLQSILQLGGYMILFNVLNLIPHIILNEAPIYLAPVFEITGGLSLLKDNAPFYTLVLLPFGGFSCIAQTYSCIKNTPLSIAEYTIHKFILTAITASFYVILL